VDHLNAALDHSGSDNGLETGHRSDAKLVCTMILLNAVVKIGALPGGFN
jgi:hypothetical protein